MLFDPVFPRQSVDFCVVYAFQKQVAAAYKLLYGNEKV